MLQTPKAAPEDLRRNSSYVKMARGMSTLRLWDDGRASDDDRFRLLTGDRWWVAFARILREAEPSRVLPHLRWRFLLYGMFYEDWVRPYLGRRVDFWDFLVNTGKDRLSETGEEVREA